MSNPSLGTQVGSVDVACHAVAAGQHGLLSRRQARANGMSESQVWRRTSKGLLAPVLPGIYRIAGAPETHHQRVLAACLWAGDGSAGSHRTAGALHDFPRCDATIVEITGPRRLRPPPLRAGQAQRVNGVVLHTATLNPGDMTTVRGIPVTTKERTVVDLAGFISPADLEEVLDNALSKGSISLIRIRWALAKAGGRGKRGSRELRRLLDQRAPLDSRLESPLEAGLLRLLRAAGLPLPQPQVTVTEKGRTLARVDFAYPEHRLAIETDGWLWHSGRRAWQRDRGRRNDLTRLGWRVLHVTSDDLKRRPEAVITLIGRALQGPGPPA
ncbi:DUF559 domain-containing protein [soil metagenome]